MDTPSGSKYSISIRGTNFEMDREIEEPAALSVISLLMGGRPMAGAGPASVVKSARQAETPTIDEGSGAHALSPGEFLSEVEAKRNPDKIVALAEYLRLNGDSTFSKDEIKDLFQAAHEPQPANFPRDFNAAAEAKLIAPVQGEKDAFYVTNTGQKAVGNRFPPEMRKPVNKPRRSKKQER